MNLFTVLVVLVAVICCNSPCFGRDIIKSRNEHLLFSQVGSYLRTGRRIVAFTTELSIDTKLGTNQAVVYNEVLLNKGNAYNRFHGHFTAPVRGIYLLSASMLVKQVGKHILLDMVHNGVTIAVLRSGSYYNTQSSRSFPVMLQRGDQVWMRTSSVAASSVGYTLIGKAHSMYNSFSGVLLNKF
ncbi:complement C1q tumor necrosis factor-related protein 3-like [Mytilus trossulus]|uniref:complement C1q tumor necrosis factor-related protein 3-like n=1 Tax=Mytilus trossulus TaxID=6551 RepID=UPI00300776BC